MPTSSPDKLPISPSRLESLQVRQQEMYLQKLIRFEKHLQTKGKDRTKAIGYAEDSITPRISRFHRAVEWLWEHYGITIEITPDHIDRVVKALSQDRFRTESGDRFSEGSKRKFNDVFRNWFQFQGVEWEPPVTFSDGTATDTADPFTKNELRQLWQAALEYKSTPSYNNLSPDERDRWRAHIAQELGKPKQDVSPDDWQKLNRSWKIPSLIRTTRSNGWRPALVGRMCVDWYDPAAQRLIIPEGGAVKNDASWEQNLSDEGALALENWLEQRKNIELYDGRDEIWLNREGNPYNSASLNRLLRNLIAEASINSHGRKLVWYSFRHSVGTYLYEEYTDLEIVAERLRQKSTTSAERYVHPTTGLKKEAANLL